MAPRTQPQNSWRRIAAVLPKLSRLEWGFVALVVLSYVFFLSPENTNSISRFDMVVALSHGTAIIDPLAKNTIDVSLYHGHYYSPRSIGLSLLALPVFNSIQTFWPTQYGGSTLSIQIAFLNMFTVVPAALIAVIAFHRFVLRLRPALAGTPLPLIATSAFALATLFLPFSVIFFSHAFGGALVFLGFYLLYRSRSSDHPERYVVGAGLLVGFAIISEYPTGLIMLILAAYIAAVHPTRRWRLLIAFALGMLPSAVILGWYDWFAFGNVFHLSYEYVAGSEFSGQHSGFFGIGLPQPDAFWQVWVWPRGLLVESPFLIFIVLGFWRWLRRRDMSRPYNSGRNMSRPYNSGRNMSRPYTKAAGGAARPSAEAVVCLAVTVVYTLLVSSYFLPMGGENIPGPRLIVPMLPFACLSLAYVVDEPRRWLRSLFAVLLAFGTLITYLYVVLGVREFHTYSTYPITNLFVPVLQTGIVPKVNGDTPPNLANLWFNVPQNLSVYIVLIPLVLWIGYILYALWRYTPTPQPAVPLDAAGEADGVVSAAPSR